MDNDLTKTIVICFLVFLFIFINKLSDSKCMYSLIEKNSVNNEKIDYIYKKIKEHSEGSAQ